ncbi:MAG: hypothetical protein VXX14_01790, partial [Pseudomonadota bacterium]|nr:hypothetical protein [Pseudomonadota bacterium]
MMRRFLILPVTALFFLGIFLVSQPLTAATFDMEMLSKKLYLEADLAFKNKELDKSDNLLTQSLLANPANA